MMNDTATTLIRRLRDTDLASIDFPEDTRGHQVVDACGHAVGHVDALFIDDAERKVRFVRVSPDWPLETEATKFLVPVDAIASIRGGAVRLNRPRDVLAAAPASDSKLAKSQNVEFVYAHYGIEPFWSRGYAYPNYPYYR